MKKRLLILGLLAVVFSAAAQDNPIYLQDVKVMQAVSDKCTADKESEKEFTVTLESALYSCDGLNFDAQNTGPHQHQAKVLYNRYCLANGR